MDAKERADRLFALLVDYAPDDVPIIEAALTEVFNEGRAAGYAEAIEKAAKVAEDSDDEGDMTSEMIAAYIRALTPATTKEPT